MTIYVVTAQSIDFVNKLYKLEEPALFLSPERADTHIADLLDAEAYKFDDAGSTRTVDWLDDGVSRDYCWSDHQGNLYEIKLRKLEI